MTSPLLLAALLAGGAADPAAAPPALLAAIDTPAEADAFWREARGRTPFIERLPGGPDRMRVTFVLRSQTDAGLSAGFLLLENRREVPLHRLAGTDILWRSAELPADARFAYYFTRPGDDAPHPDAVYHENVRGKTRDYFADPLSAMAFMERGDDGKVRRLSAAAGPDAPDDPALVAAKAKGRLFDYAVPSRALGEDRPVSVYVPPAAGKAPGVLLIFDRETYLVAGELPAMLDALIAEGRIPPTIAVLVSPVDGERRSRDLPPNPAFQRFIADELMPFVRARHAVARAPERNVVAGSSFGGLAAMFTGLSHPELFGNVVSQSGSFWWHPACCGKEEDETDEDRPLNAGPDADMGWLIEQYALRPKAPLNIFMNVGRWEGSLMLIPNRMMHHVLRAKGYDVAYREYTGGHDIVQWRATLPGALEATIGRSRE